MQTQHRSPPDTLTAQKNQSGEWEWPTLFLLLSCYVSWAIAVLWLPALSQPLAALVVTLTLVLHSSLSHEILHGHPLPTQRASEVLAIVQPGLFIPYIRFRDTHLAHHMDARLTDPYDDPESNYLDSAVWNALHPLSRALLSFNNTLVGRILIGPLVAQLAFMRADMTMILQGNRAVLMGWVWHIPGVVLILAVVSLGQMSVWVYVLCAYAALSVLKIRTFLEHQAHARASGRSVIIEDRGPLAFLFLNNNLHAVHHMHPRVAWYRLPKLYRTNKVRYVTRNGGYVYASYAEVFRRYFWCRKDPVAHPLWPMERDEP